LKFIYRISGSYIRARKAFNHHDENKYMQIVIINHQRVEKDEEIRGLWNNIENNYPAGI